MQVYHHVGSNTTGIIRNNLNTSVVLQQELAKIKSNTAKNQTYLERRITVQGSNIDGALPVDGSVRVLGDKVGVQTLVGLLGGLGVGLLVEETAAQTGQPAVGEHSRGRTLDVVALGALVLLVHDDLPQVALVALGTEERGGEVLVVSAETGVARVGLGEDVKDLDQGPEVPADSSAPDEGRGTGLGVGPHSGLALVETVDGKAGLLIDGDLLDLVPLENNIIPGGVVLGVELRGPDSVEGVSHEDAIEPHLVRVGGGSVPEATGRGPGLLVDPVTDEVGSLLVLLLTGAPVPPEKVQTDAVVVEGVLGQVVVVDSAVGGNNKVHLVAVPVDEGLVLGQLDGSLVTLEDDSASVPVRSLGLVVVADPRVSHLGQEVVGESRIGRSQREAQSLELHDGGEKKE
ncbi:hypothetical protein HG530_001740 [Fusarium avenaceum]|nr:hypothetical protein HG530_001740 [Fusarium avenaceum]